MGGSNHADRRRLTFFPVDQGLVEWHQIKEGAAGRKPCTLKAGGIRKDSRWQQCNDNCSQGEERSDD